MKSAMIGGAPNPVPEETLRAMAHAIPVARLFAVVAFGPVHPPLTVSRKICSRAVKQFGCERRGSVQVPVAFDRVNLIAGRVEQDIAPIVGHGSDVCLPIDEAGSEVEVRLEEIILADIDVLGRHHFDDFFLGVEIPFAMHPRAGAVQAVHVHGDTGHHRRVRFTEELDVELGVGRRLDVMFDPRHNHCGVANSEPLVAGDTPSRST